MTKKIPKIASGSLFPSLKNPDFPTNPSESPLFPFKLDKELAS